MQFVRYSRLRAAKGFGMGLAIHDRVCPPPSLPFHPLSPSTRNAVYPHTNKPLGTHPKPHPLPPFLPFPFPSLPFVPHHSMPSTTSPPPASYSNQTKSNQVKSPTPKPTSPTLRTTAAIYPADPSPIQPRRNLYPSLPPPPLPPILKHHPSFSIHRSQPAPRSRPSHPAHGIRPRGDERAVLGLARAAAMGVGTEWSTTVPVLYVHTTVPSWYSRLYSAFGIPFCGAPARRGAGAHAGDRRLLLGVEMVLGSFRSFFVLWDDGWDYSSGCRSASTYSTLYFFSVRRDGRRQGGLRPRGRCR